MSASNDTTRERPMAEPATQRSGNEVGGMRAGADHGFSDPTQRSMEHDDTGLGRAATGGGAADPRLDLGGKNAPGSAATPSTASDGPAADDAASSSSAAAGATERTDTKPAADADEEEDEWRHEPVAPADEPNPLKSLGRAVADVATGGSPDASKPRDR